MTYEELVRSVEASAAEKNRDILECANREAEEIIREAEEKASGIKGGYLKESLRRATVEKNRQIYLTSEEIKASQSIIRNDLFSQAFLIAQENLKDIRDSPGYSELFKRLLEEAIREVGDGEHVLHITARDQSIFDTIGTDYQISDVFVDLESVGGLYLTSSDGKVTVYNTIESRLERTKEVFKL
ncbi:MAG: V-type ATP synthase subunit E family protein, partial [Methanobacteriota archaeon]